MTNQDTAENKNPDVTKNGVAISPFVIFQMLIAQIREVVTANLGEKMSAADLQGIRVTPGGGTAWALQSLAGEKTEKELCGIIVGWRDTRSYWNLPMDQSDGNAPPDCASVDARVGIGKPGGACRDCRFSQFGSSPNSEGQACKLVRQLFILRQENVLPEILNLPPSSLKPARQYLARLAAIALPCYGLISRIGLERAQNLRGITYSRATFTAGDLLSPDEFERAKAFATMLKPLLESAPSTLTLKDHRAEAGEII
jgi:hypothetical protein